MSRAAADCGTALLAASLGLLSFVALPQVSSGQQAPAFAPWQATDGFTPAAAPSNNYPLGPDSIRHPGIPAGETFEIKLDHSSAFPNTSRTITVYVPAQYTEATPACVFVDLDSIANFNVATVFDNLIARHAMPVTIAIGVAPGTVVAKTDGARPRYDRSFEFDNMTPRLADFLLQEVLPEVEKHATHDGRRIRLSTRAADRAIGGGSTGGIAAFNAAWQRPDGFSRVFTSIGTFVGMRGAETFNVLVRKTEPKPIRIFMQDGAYDEWPGGPEMGDWWMSNLTMDRALRFAGYDVRHVWGNGTHNGNQAAAVFPAAMEWLWHGWPAAVSAPTSGNPSLQQILPAPDSGWTKVLDDCPAAQNLTAAPDGSIHFATDAGLKTLSVTSQQAECKSFGRVLAFGADGAAYSIDNHSHSIVRTDESHHRTMLAGTTGASNLLVTQTGSVYFTKDDGSVWMQQSGRAAAQVAHGLATPSALAISPDKAWLFVALRGSRLGYSFRILNDGTLDSGEPYLDFIVPTDSDGSATAAMVTDTDGRIYAATAAGIQIFDHNGRVTAILPLPSGKPAKALAFGGPGFHTLYVSDGTAVYSRELKITGTTPSSHAAPIPDWGAG